MKLKLNYLLFTVVLLSVLGCTAHKRVRSNMITQNKDATVQLAEAAASVSQSLVELAAIEKAAMPPAKTRLPSVNSYSPNMNKLVSIDWSGPVAPLVKRLAVAGGYNFRALGVAPAIPIIITLNTKDTPLGTVLRDVAFQSGSRANIYVIPTDRVIELRYVRN